MQTPPRVSFVRRVLFPYSAEEPLSLKQRLRLVIVWAFFFTLPMLLCSLLWTIVAATPLYRATVLVLIVLIAGLIIFGTTAWILSSVMNHSARLRMQKDTRTSSTSGGRYGS